MKRNFRGEGPAVVEAEFFEDGTILLDHPTALPPCNGTIVGKLAEWAAKTPDAPWLSDVTLTISYSKAHDTRRL